MQLSSCIGQHFTESSSLWNTGQLDFCLRRCILEGTGKLKQAVRASIITVFIAAFAGILIYSIGYVRYKVNKKPATELTITKLSLTHSIERQGDELVNPYEAKATPALDSNSYAVAAGALSSKKPAAKKTTSSKPAAKKAAPNKSTKQNAAANKPAADKPKAEKPAVKPASNTSTVKKTAAKDSASKKQTVNKKTTTKQSAPKKQAAPKIEKPKAEPAPEKEAPQACPT